MQVSLTHWALKHIFMKEQRNDVQSTEKVMTVAHTQMKILPSLNLPSASPFIIKFLQAKQKGLGKRTKSGKQNSAATTKKKSKATEMHH